MEDYDHEPAVTTTPDPVTLFEHRELEIRGGLAELKRKGVRITSYYTTEKE